MTICPIAIVAGCEKCPAFKICPLKSLLGDAAKTSDTEAAGKPAAKTGTARKKSKK